MRAVEPVEQGRVDRDGVRIGYEVFGAGDPAVVFVMPTTIVTSRAWKAQVPFLARTYRVVTMDPRGNGRSDMSPTVEHHTESALLGDVWAVMDATGVDRAVLVGLCSGAGLALHLAATRPERVLGVVAVNPGMALAELGAHRRPDLGRRETYTGWEKESHHYWTEHWADFAQFFFTEMFPEPHSSKQVEDCVDWAMGATVDAMLRDLRGPPRASNDAASAAELCRRVRCPVLVIVGTEDKCQNPLRGARVAELTGGDLVVLEGSGHLPNARDPVKVNLLLRDFVRQVAAGAGRS